MTYIEDTVKEKDLLNDERISRYMQGKMDVNEESAFIEELKRDEDLRSLAIAQARLVKGMKQADNEIKTAFSQVDENTIKRIARNVTGKKNQSARWLAIAASIVFIIFVGFRSYDYYDTTSLGKEYANTFPTSTIIRGEADQDVETELKTLFNNVVEGKDLDNTTSRLATLWELSKQETYNDYTNYAPYIGWNLAIGYLRNYEKAKAKNILMEMKQLYSDETQLGLQVKEVMKKL